MKTFRVTKYNPMFRDKNGYYTLDDWTSCYDIGKYYGSSLLTTKEYEKVEKQYCNAIYDILLANDVSKLKLEGLESFFSVDELQKDFQKHDILLSTEECEKIKNIIEGQVISLAEVRSYAKLVLRDCFWCEFVSVEKAVTVSFGYDLYVYIYCENVPYNLIEEYARRKIFIEEIEFIERE